MAGWTIDRLPKVLTVTGCFIERISSRYAVLFSAFRPVDADSCVVLRPRIIKIIFRRDQDVRSQASMRQMKATMAHNTQPITSGSKAETMVHLTLRVSR